MMGISLGNIPLELPAGWECYVGAQKIYPVTVGGYVLTATSDGQRFPDTPPEEYTDQLTCPKPGNPIAGNVMLYIIGVTGSGPIDWSPAQFDQLLQVGGTTGPGDVNDGLYVGKRYVTGTEVWTDNLLLAIAEGGKTDWLAIAILIQADGVVLTIDLHDFAKGFSSTAKDTEITVAGPADFETVNDNTLQIGIFSTSTAPRDGQSGDLTTLTLPDGFTLEKLITDHVCEFIAVAWKFVAAAGTVSDVDATVEFDGPATGTIDTVTYGVMIAVSGGSGPPTPTPMGLTGTLPGGTVGVPYSAALTLTGDFTGPVTIDASSGSIPSWATPTVSGTTVTFAGTPTTAETEAFTARATDSTSGTHQIATSPQRIVIASSGGGSGVVQEMKGKRTEGDSTASVTHLPDAPFTAGNAVSVPLGIYTGGGNVITGIKANGSTLTKVSHTQNSVDGVFEVQTWEGVAGAGSAGIVVTFDTTGSVYMTLSAIEFAAPAARTWRYPYTTRCHCPRPSPKPDIRRRSARNPDN